MSFISFLSLSSDNEVILVTAALMTETLELPKVISLDAVADDGSASYPTIVLLAPVVKLPPA